MVIPGHNLGNSQVSINRTIGPTLVFSPMTFGGLVLVQHGSEQNRGQIYFNKGKVAQWLSGQSTCTVCKGSWVRVPVGSCAFPCDIHIEKQTNNVFAYAVGIYLTS